MDPERLQAALARFDALNAEDPEHLVVGGSPRPRELVQAERLERWVLRLAPEASLPLRLAARCQHLQRWAIPRGSYPEGRLGYLKWRKDLAHLHAERAGAVLQELGFDAGVIAAVRAIQLKQGLKSNPDTQVMEDALCLAFLEHEFEAFAAKHDDAKIVDIVQKTWRKMSPAGHAHALALAFAPRSLELIQRALAQGAAAQDAVDQGAAETPGAPAERGVQGPDSGAGT
jgi:hypothetical protein